MSKETITLNGIKYTTQQTEENGEIRLVPVPQTPYKRCTREGQRYYYYSSIGDIRHRADTNSPIDNHLFDMGNYAQDEETLKLQSIQVRLMFALQRYADVHNDKKIDWETSDQQKYYILINKEAGVSTSTTATYFSIGEVYFTSRENAQNAIKEFRPLINELIKHHNL